MSFGNAYDKLSMKQRILVINMISKIGKSREADPEKIIFEKPADASKAALKYIEKELHEEHGFKIIWKEVV